MSKGETKTCFRCGRRFSWRRKWASSWDEVRYCSERCRRERRLSREDLVLEDAIVDLLRARGGGKSLCPSEAAREVFGADWRGGMERCRQAARRLAARGLIVFTQSGRVVDPSTARGPVRLRLS